MTHCILVYGSLCDANRSLAKLRVNPRPIGRGYKREPRSGSILVWPDSAHSQKGSKGRAQARLKFAKAHERLANARADFQHNLSRQLIDENQAVVVETLKVKNLLKSRKLAKHIADASWFSLIQKLEYKAKEQGKHLVKIDQWFASSKTCSCCGHKVDTLPLSVRNWSCPACTVELDRDVNAAINIRQQGVIKLRAEGLSVPANGGLRKSSHALVAA